MVTRSPGLIPCPLSTLANLQTSRWSIWYVSTRLSPGSPSQMRAALLRRGPARWRSRQLALALILPPSNQRACGSFQTRTLSQRLTQASDSAWPAQNASGSAAAWFQSASYSARLLTCAAAAKAGGGGKERDSLRTLVMCEPAGAVMAGPGRESFWRLRSWITLRRACVKDVLGRGARGRAGSLHGPASPAAPGG